MKKAGLGRERVGRGNGGKIVQSARPRCAKHATPRAPSLEAPHINAQESCKLRSAACGVQSTCVAGILAGLDADGSGARRTRDSFAIYSLPSVVVYIFNVAFRFYRHLRGLAR